MTSTLERLVSGSLRQPDRTTCGASVLVAARMLNDPDYAALVEDPVVFERESLAMHRRTTSSVDVAGRLQVPWPRALGTPPWSIAHQMSGSSGVRGTTYRPHPILPGRREGALAAIRAAATEGHRVPLFIGSLWLPRHVVLVLDSELNCYEPSSGLARQVRTERFVSGDLDLAGWSQPWFSVLPVPARPVRHNQA
ncbi:MAG TPA: hypothetical protein VIR30_13610 [Nocardioides sp.]